MSNLFDQTGDARVKDERIRALIADVQRGTVTRREFLRWASVLGVSLSTCGLVLSACAPEESATPPSVPTLAPQPTTPPAGPARGGILRISCPTLGQLDPPVVSSPGGFITLNNTSSWLVEVDKGVVKPMLAERWEPSADGMTWRYYLRKDVKFNNGKPFKAEDVVFTFNNALKDPNVASPLKSLMTYVDEIVEVDDYTVEFHNSQVVADSPYHLFQKPAAIIPKDWPGDFTKNPIGTGPFQLKEFRAEEFIELERNPHFFLNGVDGNPLPYLQGVRIMRLADPMGEVAALAAGETDVIYVGNLGVVDALERIPGIVTTSVPAASHTPMHMHHDEELWQDNRVRLAMKYLVDREKCLKAAVRGHGSVGNDHVIWSGFEAYTPETPRPRDVAKAKALLAEAGYPNGFEVELKTVRLLGEADFALAYKEQAAEGGVEINVTIEPTELYYTHWNTVPFGCMQWAHRPLPGMLLSLAYRCGGSWNLGFCDEEFDALCDQAAAEIDLASRKRLYAEIAKIQSEQGNVVMAYWKDVMSPRRDWVMGYEPGADKYAFFADTYISKA